ncbi:M23 family metallopeptidase [Tunicatimonas pelagia]|uniref:M23 family metallopeptidase n=1 Tax=Tunicatimonas pelagia TaxID=931531 RepID=UPI002666E62D|nr:M23 family metallopeptidase [Tunicatimonas pelagia]WKN46405.1 M23 family metallopeptidase [Tunicatimonas pelagia]
MGEREPASSSTGHGSETLVEQGAQVNAGQVIMNSDNTGLSSGPHLHYEVIRTDMAPLTTPFFEDLDIRYDPDELQNLLFGN